jgi:fido (protein-threonine AMPylation protein)
MTFEDPDGATPLGPDEMRGLKFKHVTTRGELDELEQASMQEGLRWLFARKRGDVLDDACASIWRCLGLGRNLPSARVEYWH